VRARHKIGRQLFDLLTDSLYRCGPTCGTGRGQRAAAALAPASLAAAASPPAAAPKRCDLPAARPAHRRLHAPRPGQPRVPTKEVSELLEQGARWQQAAGLPLQTRQFNVLIECCSSGAQALAHYGAMAASRAPPSATTHLLLSKVLLQSGMLEQALRCGRGSRARLLACVAAASGKRSAALRWGGGPRRQRARWPVLHCLTPWACAPPGDNSRPALPASPPGSAVQCAAGRLASLDRRRERFPPRLVQ
jgi:hypothetical protein